MSEIEQVLKATALIVGRAMLYSQIPVLMDTNGASVLISRGNQHYHSNQTLTLPEVRMAQYETISTVESQHINMVSCNTCSLNLVFFLLYALLILFAHKNWEQCGPSHS